MHRIIAIVLTVVAAVFTPTSVPAQQESAPGPATVKDVMTAMTIPASDAIFGAASEPPDTSEKWAALRKAAETLAASGRLLMRADLARDTKTWMDMARALVTQGETTMKIAESKARDRLEQAGDDVYGTCEACHVRYLEQPK